MSRCLRCGQDNEKTARFCVGCGSQISSESEFSQATAEVGLADSDAQRGLVEPNPLTADRIAARQTGGYTGRSSSPGVLPALIVPGTAGLDSSDEFESSSLEPTREGPPNNALPFAETAPPVIEADLHRAIHDRGEGQPPRRSSVPVAPRVTRPPVATLDADHSDTPPPLHPLEVPSDAPRVLSGFLVSYESSALGQSWTVHQGKNLVGRLGAALGASVELPHATVSSRHAAIHAAAHPGRLLLKDENSTNGSFVNDIALQPEEQLELRDGDRVRFGLFTAIVKII